MNKSKALKLSVGDTVMWGGQPEDSGEVVSTPESSGLCCIAIRWAFDGQVGHLHPNDMSNV